MALIVNEIFYSIQGESLCAGLPCVFIRLTGCNLRCAFCDTRYAYEEGVRMEIDEILKRTASFPCSLVEITGGEPLLQKDTPRLVSELFKSGYDVMMETNGSFDIGRVDARCMKIVDMKCPGSNESEKNDLENLNRLGPRDQVKFVIDSRKDYEYAKQIEPLIPREIPRGNILFSPVAGVLSPETLTKWILADGLGVRLHLQLHKIIWPGEQRGV